MSSTMNSTILFATPFSAGVKVNGEWRLFTTFKDASDHALAQTGADPGSLKVVIYGDDGELDTQAITAFWERLYA